MFGFRAYDIQSQVFDTVVVFVAITVFIHRLRRFRGLGEDQKKDGWMNGGLDVKNRMMGMGAGRDGGQWSVVSGQLNRQLFWLILCYLGLSVLSLMLLPLGHMVKDFWFFGVENFFMQVANATPNSHLYPLGGINRLVLFLVLAYGLAVSLNPREQYRWLFVGLIVGTIFCAFLGLLDFYGAVSLGWYRSADMSGVLHSLFL